MKREEEGGRYKLPEMFRPLLWWLDWEALEVEEDKEDIILAAVNNGQLDHWRWLIKVYGKEEIRRVLETRLVTEVYPESLNLARLVFGVNKLRYERGSVN